MPYTVTPYPAFSWSESKARRWAECRRAHYWAVYHQHNGWLDDAEASRREAWRLGKLIRGWPAALGISLHARAAECIAACRSHVSMPPAQELRRRSARELNAVYTASRRRLVEFTRAPKRWPVLDAAYYGEAFDGDDLESAVARLDSALDRLSDCALWPAIRSADPSDVIVVDPFHSFVLPGSNSGGAPPTTVYAAPDLVLRRTATAPAELWDFKSGASGGGAVDQLLVYALAARLSLRLPPVDGGYVGGVIHLGAPSGAPDDAFAISLDDLEAATQRVAKSVETMRTPLIDATANVPGPIEAFPRTDRRFRCPRCPYRGLCEPEEYASASRVAAEGPGWARDRRPRDGSLSQVGSLAGAVK
jgi:PD-(D/E)XK nuclease superfamily